jgi:RluA family pseudouridine synthase
MKPDHMPFIRLNAAWPEVGILYEDSDLFVLDKPAGLMSTPARGNRSSENLATLLLAGLHNNRPWVREHNLTYLANAQRLEAGTSGIVVFARNRSALVSLARQFHKKPPKQTYVAVIHGALPEDTLEIDLPLAPHPTTPGLAVVDRIRGLPALTRFHMIERFRGYSLIRAESVTNRPHQIRVHLKAAGCPLVADTDYGTGQWLMLSRLKKDYRMKAEGERPLINRTALHAEELGMLHPASGAALTLAAPWPKDLTVGVKYLRKFAA